MTRYIVLLLAALLVAVGCQSAPIVATSSPTCCAQVQSAAQKGQSVQTKVLACCLALVATACPPAPTPVPPTPTNTGGSTGTGGSGGSGGVPQTPEQTACANLSRLGCPEGADQAKCVTQLRQLESMGHGVVIDVACLRDAPNQLAVRSECQLPCGGIQ